MDAELTLLAHEGDFGRMPLPVLASNFEPREYQRKIAETASSTNTLVVLPTGLGKTNIAILVTANVLNSHPNSKIVVLAPTRPLVLQHCRTFKAELNLPEGSLVALTGTVEPGERETLWLKALCLPPPRRSTTTPRKDGFL
jgi:Fanconi anemia group M protein